MKKIFFLLTLIAISFTFLSSCDEANETTVIPSVEFTLPNDCRWLPVMEQYKIQRIDHADKLAELIKYDGDETPIFDINFEKETLLLVYFITKPVKGISQQLMQYDENSSIYTYQINIENHEGDVEYIGINRFIALKTIKIKDNISIQLEINE